MPNVLIVTSSYPRREGDYKGIFIHTLCQELERNVRVHILVPDDADGLELRTNMSAFRYGPKALQKLAYRDGIMTNIWKHPWLFLMVPCFIAAEAAAIHRAVRRDPDITVVHAHWMLPQGLAAVLALKVFRSRKVAVICTAHGSDILSLRGWPWGALRRFILKRLDHLIIVSPHLRAALDVRGITTPTTVQPAGIDIRRFAYAPRAIDPQHPRLVFVGRLAAAKGVRELVEAMPLLLKNRPGLTLRIIGEGPLRSELAALCDQYGLKDSVTLVGGLSNPDMVREYHAADVLVLPSFTEGVPVVLMESMACGTLVAATGVGGITSLIEDGLTGYVLPSQEPAAIAGTLGRIFSDANTAQLLRTREAARRFVEERCDVRRQADRVIELYRSTAAQRGSGGRRSLS